MAFPATILDLQADLSLSGTWTSIATYLYSERQKPQITRGRPDETSQAVASSAQFQLNNTDARFSSHNPSGPYFGQLNRNTPFRLHVPEGSTYMRLEDDMVSNATCPSTSTLNVAGDMQLRIDVNITDWTASVLAAKWGASGVGAGSWAWLLNADGTLSFAYSLDGSTVNTVTSTRPLPWPGGRISLILEWRHTTGQVQFFWATSITGIFNQIGSNVTGPSGVFNAGTGNLRVGYNGYFAGLPGYEGTFGAGAGVAWAPEAYGGLNGKVYEFRMLNAASGGTLIANPVFSAKTPGTTSWNDTQGNTWTLVGTASITNRKFRFCGEVGEWPPRWDPSGNDVYIAVQANGLLRRLQQKNAPLDSSMTRGWARKTGTYAPVAYWPAEDGNGATGTTTSSVSAQPTSIASGLSNGDPMSLTGKASTFATNTDFLCSLALPVPGKGTWTGTIPHYVNPASSPADVVRFLLSVPSGGDTDATVIARYYTRGSVAQVDLYYGVISSGSLRLVGYDNAGNQLFDSAYVGFGVNGNPCMVEMALTVSGSTVTWHLNTMALGAASQSGTSGTISSSSIDVATVLVVNPAGANVKSAMGQFGVQSSYARMDGVSQAADSLIGPLNGWAGETAGLRFARLCAEEGYASRLTGYPSASVVMGPQTVNTFMSLLQECESADQGMICEPRQALALAYRCSATMVNQAPFVLDYVSAQLGGGGGMSIEPTDDDALTVNDETITRGTSSLTGSSFETVETPAAIYSATGQLSTSPPGSGGVGPYQDAQTVNVWSDSQLGDQAGWRVHLGTVNELRYPSVPVDLARPQMAAIANAAQDLDLGDYLQMTTPPVWLSADPVKAIVWGVAETLGGFIFTIAWQTQPESPYEVLVAGTGALTDPRADADASTLSSGCTAGATTISVATPSGYPLWTTTAGDLPLDILVSGERMTVTAISGSSSPQSFTVTRAVNGISKAHLAGEPVNVFAPVYAALA